MGNALLCFLRLIIGKAVNLLQFVLNIFFCFSDQMGNKGAFITLDGKTMKPKFTTYDAVVSLQYLLWFFGFYSGFFFSPILT